MYTTLHSMKVVLYVLCILRIYSIVYNTMHSTVYTVPMYTGSYTCIIRIRPLLLFSLIHWHILCSSEGNSQVAPSPTPSSNVPPRPPKPASLKIDSAEMSTELLEMWCIYLQERVATEIYRLSMLTQNQQSLCQVRLLG